MSKRQEISSNPEIHYRIFLHKLKTISTHCHDAYELLYVLSGSATVNIEDKAYILKEDDLILVNPNQLHELHSGECVMIVLQIKPEVILSESEESLLPFFTCNSSNRDNKKDFHNLKVLIAKLIKLSNDQQNHTTMMAKAFLYELIYELYNHFQTPGKVSIASSNQKTNRITKILDYINENYATDITLTQLSKQEYLSVSYLSRYFEKKLGQSFKSHLTSVRLNHAFNDLCTSNMTIGDISAKNGFPNPRSFVTAFKSKYNCLPSQYRKDNGLPIQYESQSPEPIEYQEIPQNNYLSKLSKYLEDDFVVKPETIVNSDRIEIEAIDVRTNQKRLFHHFRNMLAMGHAKDIQKRKTQEMLVMIQKDIKFKYLQTYGFFDRDVQDYFLGVSENDQFNYDLTDEIVDFLLSIGLKPMFKLGFEYRNSGTMANMLRHDPLNKTRIKKWSRIVENFISHLIHRYSIEEVQTWRFTLQEEADVGKLSIMKANETRYYQLYSSTYEVIKSIDAKLSFGPSAVLPYMVEGTSVPEAFFQYMVENNCLADFLSIKYYPVIFNDEASMQPRITLSMNPDGLKDFISHFKNMLEKNMLSHIPLFLTQWNSTISNRDLLNDTCYKSAYLVKNIVDNYDDLESFGYWTLSDHNSLHIPGRALFHGGLGLLTKNGIKKAAYNGLSLLAKLGSHLLVKGPGYIVTKRDHSYQILVFNYQHYTELYGMGENYDLTPSNRYAPFAYARSKQFCFTLDKIPHDTFIQSEYIISREHGSGYDIWESRFPVSILDPVELDMLKGFSEPLLSKHLLQTKDNRVELNLTVAPHEVKLITLTPHY